MLLPLGGVAGSLGLSLPRARFGVLTLAVLMTGLATLLVGPVSFIGLLGPHLARKTGVKGALAQLYTAALLSACIMTRRLAGTQRALSAPASGRTGGLAYWRPAAGLAVDSRKGPAWG